MHQYTTPHLHAQSSEGWDPLCSSVRRSCRVVVLSGWCLTSSSSSASPACRLRFFFSAPPHTIHPHHITSHPSPLPLHVPTCHPFVDCPTKLTPPCPLSFVVVPLLMSLILTLSKVAAACRTTVLCWYPWPTSLFSHTRRSTIHASLDNQTQTRTQNRAELKRRRV